MWSWARRHGCYGFILGIWFLVGAAWAQAPSNPSLNAQLLVAARQGDLPAVTRALERGAAPDSRNRLGKTVLLLACEKGNEAMAQAMIAARADVNLPSLNKVTPLMAASYIGHTGILRALLQAGAKTELQDHLHKPAIVYAAGEGRSDIVALLLDQGVPVDGVYEHQLSALMWAAGQGHAAVVRLIVSRGARVDLRDDRGLTAADMARQAGHTEALAALQLPTLPSR